MNTLPKTVCIIPCFNEIRRFSASHFNLFVHKYPNIAFVFVNDGSTDETEKKLLELAKQCPDNMHCVSLPCNRGKGEAVRQGMLFAIAQYPSCKYLGYWDADLATPLFLIPEFLRVFSERPYCQVVIGSRIKSAGRDIQRNFFRHYLGRIVASCTQILLRPNCYDTQCGAKIFAHTNALRVILQKSFVSRWIFDIELLLRLRNILGVAQLSDWNAVAFELPLSVWHEQGHSKIRIRDALLIPYYILRIYIDSKKFPKSGTITSVQISSSPPPPCENTHDSPA